jgi:hypothetical protein
VADFKLGKTPESIHGAFEAVSLADVYAIFAHYLRHRACSATVPGGPGDQVRPARHRPHGADLRPGGGGSRPSGDSGPRSTAPPRAWKPFCSTQRRRRPSGADVEHRNYLGFPSGISGGELADRAVLQVDKFGARRSVPAMVAAWRPRTAPTWGALKTVPRSLDAASSSSPASTFADFRCRGWKGSRPASITATPLEAHACVGAVVVVGGGNSAGKAALFMADHAAEVRMVVRETTVGTNMSRYLADRIAQDPRIEVHLHTEVAELEGEDGRLDAVVARDTSSDDQRRVPARPDGVHRGDPSTSWHGTPVAVDAGGYVVTGPDARRVTGPTSEPLPLVADLPGPFEHARWATVIRRRDRPAHAPAIGHPVGVG